MDHSRYSEVAVVIPALNEEDSLPHVLDGLAPLGLGHVVVVDNDSTDRTAEVARERGALVVNQPQRGYGNACQAGIRKAAELGASVLVIMDADHSVFAEDLPLLVDPILAGQAELVLGDRTKLAEAGSLTPQQLFGNRLATFLIGRVTGHRFRDMGPFRALDLSRAQQLGLVDANYGWNVEMQMKAVRQGLWIREVPVRYRNRVAGRSKISGSVRGTLKAGAKIVWSVYRYSK